MLATDFVPTRDSGFVATGSTFSPYGLPQLLVLKADRNDAVARCARLRFRSLDMTAAATCSVESNLIRWVRLPPVSTCWTATHASGTRHDAVQERRRRR